MAEVKLPDYNAMPHLPPAELIAKETEQRFSGWTGIGAAPTPSMAEVKRYDLEWRSCMGGYSGSNEMVESSDGEWLRYDDAITLERRCQELEREHAGLGERYDQLTTAYGDLCAECDRLGTETVECAQIIGEALRAIQCPDDGPVPRHIGHLPDMCRDLAAEVERLRKIEAAANGMINAGLVDISAAEDAYTALAAALRDGRKG